MLQRKSYIWIYMCMYIYHIYVYTYIYIYIMIKAPFKCSQEGRKMWLKNVKHILTMPLFSKQIWHVKLFFPVSLKRKPTNLVLLLPLGHQVSTRMGGRGRNQEHHAQIQHGWWTACIRITWGVYETGDAGLWADSWPQLRPTESKYLQIQPGNLHCGGYIFK